MQRTNCIAAAHHQSDNGLQDSERFKNKNKAKAMSEVWKTKYGPRRVRNDPPTLEEAISAARGLSDDVAEQVEIAAALIDRPREEVMAAAARLTQRKDIKRTVAFTGRAGGRAVVVERKMSRRVPASRSARS
jgi:hypothetical protein